MNKGNHKVGNNGAMREFAKFGPKIKFGKKKIIITQSAIEGARKG